MMKAREADPLPDNTKHQEKPPFLNNLWMEDPLFKSGNWRPMFRMDNAGYTFKNKKDLAYHDMINHQAPQSEWRKHVAALES